jgi:hypothetical protein
MMSAEPGQMLDPIAVDATWWLVIVDAKTLPLLSDPVLRERAEGLITERTLRRAIDETFDGMSVSDAPQPADPAPIKTDLLANVGLVASPAKRLGG